MSKKNPSSPNGKDPPAEPVFDVQWVLDQHNRLLVKCEAVGHWTNARRNLRDIVRILKAHPELVNARQKGVYTLQAADAKAKLYTRR